MVCQLAVSRLNSCCKLSPLSLGRRGVNHLCEIKMIEGGFYLKARCIQNADIAHAPPHVREIWDWLLLKASFNDGKILKRGQVFVSYSMIIDALSWNVGWRKMHYSRSDCENAMKALRKAGMITTKKTTRGLLVTICKYEYYQNIKMLM